MANTRTLAQMRTSVQYRGGYENSADITAAILNEAINKAIAEVWDILIAKWADYYTLTTANITVASGTASYALDNPAGSGAINFYKLRKVEMLVSGSGATAQWCRLAPHDLESSHLWSSPGSNKGYRYRLQAGNLVLAPTPGAAETMRWFYIPYPTRLSADGDTFDGINGYEELVIQMAFRECRVREDLDTAAVDGEIARLTARVRSAADGRDASEPFYLGASGPGEPDGEPWP